MSYRNSLLISLILTSTAVDSAPLVDPTMPADYKSDNGMVADVVMTNDSESPVWTLNTTLIDSYQKIAMINGQQLVIGDEIDGAELIEIAHQFVTLRYQDELITLNLHQSFISQIKSK